MMLARVADALYWMGRYIERAENVTRLVLVTSELAVELEGLDDASAQAEWDAVLAALPGAASTELDFSPEAGLAVPYVRALLLEPTNPVSVYHSLGRARDNARSIREALTRETFLSLNEGYRQLGAQQRRAIRDPATAHELVSRTHKAILETLGAVEHTFTRDQRWSFMKLGEAIERVARTLLVLRAKLPHLRVAADEVAIPLVYARWRSLLRSLASLENFRQEHGARLGPETVLRFLLFDPWTPRSVRCGVARMKRYVDALPGPTEGLTGADRVVGRLLATLTYDAEAILAEPDLTAFLDATIDRLGETHEAIGRQYFPV